MPQGECFSNVTLKPHLSTMCEPITGSAYLMAAMAYSGQFDMRVYSPQVNAGAYKEISMNGGCNGDWDQWASVPYYTDVLGDGSGIGKYSYDIKRVYMANDNANLYMRIDLSDWELPGYQEDDVFAVQVYADTNTSGVTSTSISMTGDAMTHAMSYMVMRSSGSDVYERYVASDSGWDASGAVNAVIAPQWEVSSGRIELAVPYASIGNSSPMAGDWTNLRVVLLQKQGAKWVEADSFNAHYRVTTEGMEWLKGNFQ